LATAQILDYGSGNLFSIANALKRASPDLKVKLSSSYKRGSVDGLVLPGVGSFPSAQKILGENRERILADVSANRIALLGVCLGMQLMFDSSEEGEGVGLGIFRGNVVRFKSRPGLKVPHMGWNTVSLSSSADDSKLCRGLSDGEWAYFVHSFFPLPKKRSIVRAWTEYGGRRFASIVEEKNVFGTQFHPEKSHAAGAKLLKNFVRAVKKKSKAGDRL
jgi:imidazole glycerol-phosphate synthase subunit HisH